MRAGILIGTAVAALGVVAGVAPAHAEPCPPEICYVPAIPGVPSGVLNMLPQSMGDLPPQLSQYPGGWGDQRWGGWNQRDSIDIYDTPAPEVPAPAPGTSSGPRFRRAHRDRYRAGVRIGAADIVRMIGYVGVGSVRNPGICPADVLILAQHMVPATVGG